MEPGRKRFPRRIRLTSPGDYQQVFKSCRYRQTQRWLTLLATPNQLGHPRLGLVISRKVAGDAVARNRIKRLARESFRHWQSRLDAVDIVLLGRPGIARQSNRVLVTALENLWTQLIETCAGSSSN
ncbi:MAG: ribonuclease P protein component [Gammaproteobacteria bacterium]